MNDFVLSDSFADYFVILLMSRCRAISAVELLSASASTIIQYSSANGRNGQIRDKDSYGNDPCPPKDTCH